MGGYVHGYDGREAARLENQARTLEELLHADTGFPAARFWKRAAARARKSPRHQSCRRAAARRSAALWDGSTRRG